MYPEIWEKPAIISWIQILLNSYKKLLNHDLINRNGDPFLESKAVFFAPFILVSHGTQSDPILNYGNQVALDLWETTWDSFISIPSRLTAEPINQQERQLMLSKVTQQGFVDDYRGVRISCTGKRFLVEQAIVWNLLDSQGRFCGQAATFPVPPPDKFLPLK